MRILDKEDHVLENPDLNLGYLTEEKVFVQHHDATEEVQQQSHWETVKQYDDGEKAEALIIDVPYQPAKEAWDEYEYIQRYTEYTEEQLADNAEEAAKVELDMAISKQIKPAMMMFAQSATTLTAEQASTIPALFPEWKPDMTLKQGQYVRWDNNLYYIMQDYTSVAQYTPDQDITHYKPVTEPDDDGMFQWPQPLCAEDSYSFGDKVKHNGSAWQSNVPGEHTNCWEPGVYGWDKLEVESGEGEPEEVPEFVQPIGQEDAYHKGDRVKYNGEIYESIFDGLNVWSPDAYPQGWQKVVKVKSLKA